MRMGKDRRALKVISSRPCLLMETRRYTFKIARASKPRPLVPNQTTRVHIYDTRGRFCGYSPRVSRAYQA